MNDNVAAVVSLLSGLAYNTPNDRVHVCQLTCRRQQGVATLRSALG
jgi:hypothetical protein